MAEYIYIYILLARVQFYMQHRAAFGPSDLSSRTELGYFYHIGGKDNNTSVKGQLRNN